MKLWQKTLLLLLLIVANIFVNSQIALSKIEWSKLFPQQHQTQKNRLLSKQYLLCHLDDNQTAVYLQDSPLFQSVVALPEQKGSYLCLFDMRNKEQINRYLQNVQKSGTFMVQQLLFDDFYKEIHHFVFKILPFTLLFLLFFIPLRLWIDILLEMSIYTLLLGLFLRLGFFEINSASLLALLFLFIYSLTLINYLYSENIDVKRLSFGISISIVATMLSALFLIYSQFGLLHYFGVMLFVGLVVLYLYINARLFLFKYLPHEAHRHNFDVTSAAAYFKKRDIAVAVVLFVFTAIALFGYKAISVDLNILNSLQKSTATFSQMKDFEQHYVPSLLFGVEVQTKKSSFHDMKEVEKLLTLQERLQQTLQAKILLSVPLEFAAFKEMAHDKNNPDLLAQFLLANSFANTQPNLFSPDMSSTYFIAALPLETSSDKIIAMKHKIAELDGEYKDLHIVLRGKVADFDNFLHIFFQESFTGLFVTLFVSVLFFLFYCKNLLSVFIVFFSVIFSLAALLLFHLLFAIPLSLTTLMSLILYAGLVADSFIQLFICYKSRDLSCEKSVLNPIFVSNISILAFLVSMIFVGGIIGAFAFDMFVLLGANLVFIIIFVPMVYKKQLSIGSER